MSRSFFLRAALSPALLPALLVLGAVLISPRAGQAQESGSTDVVINLPQGSSGEMLQKALYDRWFAWKRHIAEGDMATVETIEEEILALVSRGDIQGVDVLAGATARQGLSFLEQGRTEEARRAFELAEAVRARLPDIHYSLASLQLTAETDVSGWVRQNLRGLGVMLRGLWGDFFLKANLLVVVLTGLVYLVVCFGLVMFFKYQSLFRHGVSEALAGRFTMDLGRMLGLALLFLPAFLWLGPVAVVLWWLAMLYPYMDMGERVLAWIGALALAALPLGLQQVHATTTHLDDPVLLAASELETGDVDQRTILELASAVNLRPENDRLQFLYATALVRAGRQDQARDQLRRLVEQSPGFERAWNNLGNVYFREGDFKQAIQTYEKAVETGGCYALAHYNQALAYQNDLKSRLYHQEIAAARNCDADLVDSLSSQEGVVDASLSEDELLDLVRNDPSAEGDGGGRENSLRLLANPLSILAVLALLFLGTRSFGSSSRRAPRACVKCGRPFCQACQPGASTSAYCTQCIHLYIKKDGVAPAVRVQKGAEVDRYVNRVRWFGRALNFLVPGAGHLFEENVVPGLVLLSLWSFLLAALVFAGRIVVYPQQVTEGGGGLLLVLNLVGLVLVWAWANLVPLVRRR